MRAEYDEKISGWEAEIVAKRETIANLSAPRRASESAPSSGGGAPGGGSSVPSAPPNKPSKKLPSGWKAARDPDSGDTYYVSDSGETSWDFPGTDIVI